MTHVAEEIASQPACWRRAIDVAAAGAPVLPRHGERLAVVGCGTSHYMTQVYAAYREAAGFGETDAFPASEFSSRRYDRVLALSRSGTTTEVVELLSRLRGTVPTVVITAEADAPVAEAADETVVLDFANERAVVHTRFATTALAVLRAHLGHDIERLIEQGERAVAEDLPAGVLDRTQFTFLGRGATVGVAYESALKLREAARAWAEAYPAMEYRHGPMSITDERSVVWAFGEPPAGLADEVRAIGGRWVNHRRDPLADLILVQRLAVALAQRAGLDPDRPRNLARSVILAGRAAGG